MAWHTTISFRDISGLLLAILLTLYGSASLSAQTRDPTVPSAELLKRFATEQEYSQTNSAPTSSAVPRIQLKGMVFVTNDTGAMILQVGGELISVMLRPFRPNDESRPMFMAGGYTFAIESYSVQGIELRIIELDRKIVVR